MGLLLSTKVFRNIYVWKLSGRRADNGEEHFGWDSDFIVYMRISDDGVMGL